MSNPLIAKCGSLLLWLIANPLYKIGTKKNECPPNNLNKLAQFGIDKDNFKN